MSYTGDKDALQNLPKSDGYNGYILQATAVFNLYDYAINLDREVTLFWRYPFTVAAGLYFFNRYSCLARAMYYLYSAFVQSPPDSLTNCVTQWFLSYALDLTPVLPVAVFSCLRTYALTQRITLSALVLVLSLAPFVINWLGHTWHVTFEYDSRLSWLGDCLINMPLNEGPDAEKILVTASRLPLILADIILVVATWMRTYRLGRSTRRLGMQSLSGVMFRNGNVQAITLLLLNSCHWTFSMLSLLDSPGSDTSNAHSSILNRLIDPVSEVLVSHFLLDLQEVAASHEHQHSEGSASSIRFSIGALGSTLPGPLEARNEEGRYDYQTGCHGHDGDVRGDEDAVAG